jgi:ABC-type Mn2+/Zn2+ transport system permease subunit
MVHAALTSWLTGPWEDPILRRAFLAILLLGVAGGALGCWLVFYGLAYSAESLSHALLPGLVLAALAGAPLLLGAAGGIVVAAVAVALAGRTPEIGRDTAVAVVVTALFGLGVLLALSPDTPPRLGSLLFGDVLGLSDGDLALAALAAAACLGALWVLHGRLLVVGFDRGGARGLGVRATPVDAVLLVLLAAVLLVAVRALGNLLVVAVLIAPAAAARLVARRMAPMLLVAAGLAVLAGWSGLYLSFHAETAAGASVAAALVASYAAVAAGAAVRRAAG